MRIAASSLVLAAVIGCSASGGLVALLAADAAELRVLIHGYVDGGPCTAIATVRSTGLTDVADVPFPDGGELSPDGEHIAFDTCKRSERAIATARLDNTDVKILAPVSGEMCATVRWSRDASRVSYAGAYDFLVHVIDLASGIDVAIPGTFFATGWHSWSPTSDAIVFENGRGGSRRLDVVDLATWRSRTLVGARQLGGCETWAPDWSPRGERIAFTSCDGTLYVINADGSGLRKIAGRAYAPRWSPDGRSILFLVGRILARVDPDAGAVQTVGNMPYFGGPFSIANRP